MITFSRSTVDATKTPGQIFTNSLLEYFVKLKSISFFASSKKEQGRKAMETNVDITKT